VEALAGRIVKITTSRHGWWIAAALRIVVGGFLLLAAGAKFTLSGPGENGAHYGVATFAAVIKDHKIVPEAWAYAAAVGSIVVEACVGVWLLSHVRARQAAIVTTALLAAFGVYLLVAYARVGNASCGCMGKLNGAKLSDALVRNGAMIATLIPSMIGPWSRSHRGALRRDTSQASFGVA